MSCFFASFHRERSVVAPEESSSDSPRDAIASCHSRLNSSCPARKGRPNIGLGQTRMARIQSSPKILPQTPGLGKAARNPPRKSSVHQCVCVPVAANKQRLRNGSPSALPSPLESHTPEPPLRENTLRPQFQHREQSSPQQCALHSRASPSAIRSHGPWNEDPLHR